MGAVYRAYDTKLRRKVALKVIHPDQHVPDAAARLVREARAAAALTHPNTIAIYDLGEINGTVFLVMELIEGASLRAYVGDDSVSVARKLRWLVDVARGLDAAHKAGLVHRDVKPTNIMVSTADVVKVLDFGLAKALEAASFHTEAGMVVGTPRYMAPELFAGVRADARSDQYAFGVTAYELLSGVHPGGQGSPVPAALDALVPEVGSEIARVVARTLSRGAADRFASMSDVATALESRLFALHAGVRHEACPTTHPDGAGLRANVALAPTALASSEDEPGERGEAFHARAQRKRYGGALLFVAVPLLAALSLYGASHFLPDSSLGRDDGFVPSIMDAAGVATDVFEDAGGDASGDGGDASDNDGSRRIQVDDFRDPWTEPTRVLPAN